MKKKFVFRSLGLIIIVLAVLALFVPLFNNTKYGLDLQGGFEVLYKVSPIEGKKLTSDMLTSTYKTIQRRIDVLGVSEPEVIVEGKDRVRVKLAGIKDQTEARRILSTTASLTFRDSKDNLLMTSSVLSVAKYDQDGKTGLPVVALSIKDNDKFYEVTKKISESQDKLIVIWLDFEEGVDSYEKEKANCGSLSDSKCLSAATVPQGFASNVVIQGRFTKEEATELANLISSGSIPTKLSEISSRTVGAAFGEKSLEKTFTAGIIGILIVMLIMTYLYRFAGFITSIAILFYTFLTFLVFYCIGGVLTLPGIAALVLGIGMAVDANVLNYEAMKEELAEGSDLKSAFHKAHKRSFLAIFDANITTLIVAVIMFMFGESSVKGFATMLMVNIVITIVVMVYLTQYMLKKFVETNYFNDKKNIFIKLYKKNRKTLNIDFLKHRKKFVIGSLIIIIAGLSVLFTKGFNLGIDYKGGSDITIIANDTIKSSVIKKDINELGYEIIDIANINKSSIYAKVDDVLSKDKIKTTTDYFKEKYDAKTEIGVVSNIVKKEMTRNALYAVLLSFLGIIAYVALRFKFSYGVSGVAALLHDILFVVAAFAIFGFEVNSIFIAAILTIIGYSINDTIVIYDRIRENIFKAKKGNIKSKEELYDTLNKALNQTMRRTIYTSLTVLLVVICLILFGSYEIFNFNLALLFGLVSGTYSTIFIAAAICYEIDKNNVGKKAKPKKEYKELDEIIVKGINS